MGGIVSQRDIERIEAEDLPPDLPESTYALIGRAATQRPDAPALSFFLQLDHFRRPETWTYRQLFGRITQTANLFHALGADKDTVIAYVLPNLPETHWTIWGGEAAGIVLAINPLLEAAAIAELLGTAQATILVTLAPFPGTDLWQKVQQAIAQTPSLKHVLLINLADHVPGIKGWIAKRLQRREEKRLHGRRGVAGALPKHLDVRDFKTALDEQPADRLRSGRVIQANDYSSFFCTGGTTGTPKIAMRRHGNEIANAWSAAQTFGDVFKPDVNLFCGLPLFHANAVFVTGLLPFSQGAHVVLGPPQGYRTEGLVKRFWEIVEHYRINFFSGVPTLYAGLLQLPVEGRDLSSLQFGICGAAPLPLAVFREFEARTGLKILEGYGLTEGNCVSSVNPPLGERRPGSIGLRLPGQRMKAVVLDDDGRYLRDCAPDEVGALLISGPNVFAGYRIAEQDKGLWVDLGDGRRWLNTGDLARQDADGYFWLTGRKKELIIRGGHNIDPAMIEDPLHRHPAVQTAAAIARPDAYAGELPVAYVQLKPGAKASEEALLEFLRGEIAERAALPKRIRILDIMPLTPIGKIYKPALKRREAEDALCAALDEAGVAVRELRVEDDRLGGLVVYATPDDGVAPDDVRQVLERFPLGVRLQ